MILYPSKLTRTPIPDPSLDPQICDDVPTEVQALSSGVTAGWLVTTANSIGTVCGWLEDSRFPGLGNTSKTEAMYQATGITGTVPTELGVLTAMSVMTWAENDITGTLPTEIGRMTNLKNGNFNNFNNFNGFFSSNSLTGSLPTELGNLVKMTRTVAMQTNSFTGTIPTELGSLSIMLQWFYLNSNSLTGAIPSQLGKVCINVK